MQIYLDPLKNDPNPGSNIAKTTGCTCDQGLNQYGKGAGVNDKGQKLFYINEKCPVHRYYVVDAKNL